MRILPTAALSFCLALPVAAQDRPNTILIMDGSGSMWGQIDGIAKIAIAQDVVTQLLDTLPGEERLGLTVYGHRERGNCTDIETIVAPAEGTRDAIAQAVGGIQPLGKTPMTDAVIAAAEALRYTEDSATVILVSDGVETCNPDPCAAARALEAAAVDFTAHVIGFDVGGDAEATAQMQCIADETGGMFIPASDSGELAAALTTVVEEPEPVAVAMTFTAVIGDDKRLIESPVLWDINQDAGLVAEDVQANPLETELPEGAYVATAYSLELEQTVNVDFVVGASADTQVEAVFEEPALTAVIIAAETVPGGSMFPIGWEGPNDDGDNIQMYPADDDQRYTYVYTDRGNPISMIAPFDPGMYELRYVHRDRDIIGTKLIEVTAVPVGLEAPTEVNAGSDFSVTWTGPDAPGDNVQIGPIGETVYSNYQYTDRGNPVSITAPTTPGTYELRYKFRDQQVIYTQPITVTEVTASITAPTEAEAGSTITVEWIGPDYDSDYIGIGEVGAEGASQWDNYFRTDEGSPAKLLIPADPGDYQISYFVDQDRSILATVPITVTAVGATLTAPAEAEAGSTITVEWTGPNYDRDYIGIGEVGAEGSSQWNNYFRTDEGSPAKLLIPADPGDYQISYFVDQDRSILATVPITVTAVGATLTAPAEAEAGSTITVEWTGPNYDRDYIGIGEVGAEGSSQWDNYFRTDEGSPAKLLIPADPGDYQISYFVDQDRSVLATVPITVTSVSATLSAPPEAVAGSTIAVDWTGPNYPRDYIGIGLVGATGSSQWENYFRVDTDTPGQLLVPPTPGDYLITYFIDQDRSALKALPITVTPIENVQLLAEDAAPGGSDLIIGWDGPAYARDYIGIGKVGATGSAQWEVYARADEVNPVTITLPEEPGDYVITYFVDQGRTPIKSRPLTIE